MTYRRAIIPLVLLATLGGFDFALDGLGPSDGWAQVVRPGMTGAGGSDGGAAPEGAANAEPFDPGVPADPFDNFVLLMCAVLVLFMQAGFAMVEAGFNSQKNVVNILFKNVMDICIGVMLYAIVGFNLMYPGDNWLVNGWMPGFSFLLPDEFTDRGVDATYVYTPQADFLFQAAFAATAATIVSGAVAGRMKFEAYLIYSAVLTGILYPISGSWKWGGGWLADAGFYDLAGSCVVHAVGGFAGLAGAIVLGPRLGRFTADGKSVPLPGHSITVATLGVFILLIGWYGFNPGSQLTFNSAGDAGAIARIAVNTTLGAAAGGFMAMVISWCMFGKPDISMALNGVLGGLVSVTANCDGVTNSSAVIIGLVGGVLVVMGVLMLDKLRIDDPVGAWPVHGLCGLWGCVACGIFEHDGYFKGIMENPDAGNIVPQLIGCAAYAIWGFATMFVLFAILRAVGLLRVSPEEEERGLDISEHGMAAYSTT